MFKTSDTCPAVRDLQAPGAGAEVDRLTVRVTANREAFLVTARDEAARDLAKALDAIGAAGARERRARALESAIAIARTHLDRWLATEQPAAESLYRAAVERFLTLGNEFLRQPAWSWLADRVRSHDALRRAVERDTKAYLGHLLSTNSARVQNDLIERVRESRRRLEDWRLRAQHIGGDF